tara:strand:+ start:1571 stop:1774 length:204 start_codon:yes stop_codon:yes gene_type:complete
MYLFNKKTGYTAALLLILTACGGSSSLTSVDVLMGRLLVVPLAWMARLPLKWVMVPSPSLPTFYIAI